MSKDITYADLLKSIGESRDASVAKLSVLLSDAQVVKTSMGYSFNFANGSIVSDADFTLVKYYVCAEETYCVKFSQKETELLKPLLRKSVFLHTFVK